MYLTDRSDAVDIQRNVEVNIRINRIEEVASFLPLDWGEMHGSEHLLDVFRTVDVLLAADCFYQSEGGVLIVHALQIHLACALGKSLPFLSHNAADFEKVIASVALIFRCNPNCKLYATYQLRRYAAPPSSTLFPASPLILDHVLQIDAASVDQLLRCSLVGG